MLKKSGEELLLSVKVSPKAQQSTIIGWEEERLKVRLAAVPEKGKANQELIRLIAKTLGTSKSQITLASGETSRYKQIKIAGMSESEILAKLPISS